MSLNINIKYLNGALPKGEKFIKVSFRGFVFNTVAKKGETTIFYGERFTWPLARKIENRDFILIKVLLTNIVGLDKNIGVLNVGLGSLASEPKLTVQENLIDRRRKLTENIVIFDVEYVSPSTGSGDFESSNFNYPVFDITKLPNYGTNRVKLPSEKSSDDDDDFDFSINQDSNHDHQDNMSDVSLLPERFQNLPTLIDSKRTKIESFEVHVTIIKAKDLAGLSINPVIHVTCGKDTQHTDTILQTNTPFYNNFMIFPLEVTRSQLMEEIIRIECFTRHIFLDYNYVRDKIFWPKKMIGIFTIDVRTVYSNEFHSFFSKWAVLLDPKAPNSGPRGMVQVHMSVLCPGDKPKRPDKLESEESGKVEGNILMPTFLSSIQPGICCLTLMIYQAQDLPSMNTQAMSSIKHAIMGEHTPLTNPYVEVAFGGYTGRTKVIDNSYKPEWNQKVIFSERYPFFVTRIRLSVKNSNPLKDDTIATVFIELNKIMYNGSSDQEDFLPTFGPAWVNLYGSPRTMSYSELLKGDNGANANLSEGVAYRGRILIAITTKMRLDDTRLGVETLPCNPVSNTVAGKPEMYFLFGAIFEANLIPTNIGLQGKPVAFEMSIGKTGNMLDDKAPIKKGEEKPVSTNNYVNSVTNDRFCYSTDREYFYIPYGNKKPCLHMICSFEDHRPRMYIPNILEKLKLELNEYIRQTKYVLARNRPSKARNYLKISLEAFIISTDKCLSSIKACRGTAKKTSLDQKYQKLIKFDLERMKVKLSNIIHELSRKNINDKIKYLEHLSKMLEDKINYPQDGLPDIFISIIQENMRLGYVRIKSRDIIYSVVNNERGYMCGELNDIYLKRVEIKNLDNLDNLKIQGRLQMYLWLGLLKDMRGYKAGLPDGYNRDCFKERMPPNFIEYVEESMFQLRVHLMMGRNLIGSDDSGLSDPFVRVIFADSVKKSIIMHETRSPAWDQTIIIDKILLNYSSEIVKTSPPNVILELFDDDEDDSSEFLGRAFCQPSVFLRDDEYEFPPLQWWTAYRGRITAGEILASAEILEISIKSRKVLVSNVPTLDDLRQQSVVIADDLGDSEHPAEFHVPMQIRPATKYYRLEILLWGMRQLKRRNMMQMKSPILCIDFANSIITADDIEDWNVMPNFRDNLVSITFKLPEDKKFWPPISISCKNNFMFQKSFHIGICVVSNVTDFLIGEEFDDDMEMDKTTVYSGDNRFGLEGVSNGGFEDSQDLIDELDNGKKDDPTSVEIKQGGKEAVPAYPVPNGQVKREGKAAAPPGVAKKEVSVPKDELDAADWWTRYYVTTGDMEFMDKLKSETELLEESQSEDELTGDLLEDIKIKVESDDDDDVVSIPDEDVKRKKKKKKKKKRKFKSPFKKDPMVLFLKEENEELIMESGFINDNSWIDRITIYSCSLENVKDFGGFKDPYHSFRLYYGKQLEGETEEDVESKFGGVFKGNMCLYEIDEEEMEEIEDNRELELESFKLFPLLKDNSPCDFTVRVYVIKGINLQPMDYTGTSDPYILVDLGVEVCGSRQDYIPKSLNPIFGKCFEVTVKFPQYSFLRVLVYDYDLTSLDDLIGETTIDLENRWLSKHRGTCGYMSTYHNHGFLKWKDCKLPTKILEELCQEHKFPKPVYDKMNDTVTIDGHVYSGYSMIEDDDGSQVKSLEPIALTAIQNWHEIVPGCKLVPEHIETRPLYRSNKPGIEQGLLEMWVDIFPSNQTTPALIDISPRKAIEYQLRITIIQTEKVRLSDTNWLTNEKSVDIYLKGWMISTSVDLQNTDTHWKSLSGQGMFNYRFIFDFGYLKPEDATVYTSKEIFELEGTEKKIPCLLNMQVMDKDLLSADDVLGSLKFKLSKFPQPAKSYKSCCAYQHGESVAKFNLFRNKKARGWWPLLYNPKDEDPDAEDSLQIGGCVEMEMELMTKEEADSNPAGKGREEPQPLPEPNRPDGSFLNMLNPLNTIKYFIKYRLKWILIKILVILLLVLIVALFIYAFPDNFTRIIVDKMAGR